MYIESDARVALEGALAGEPGAVLIAGTGSVIFGKDKTGIIHRAGGFGRVIGDEGSGYSIGVKTLKHVSNMLDGRNQKDELLERFSTIFHVSDENDLISLVHNPGFDVASIAMFTIKNADEGSETAKNILDRESDELVKHITVVKDKLGLKPLKLVLIGSLIENQNYYSQLLTKKVKALKDIELTERKYSPEMGAVIMAQNILASNQTSTQ